MIEIKNLRKSFGATEVLKGISIDIQDGQIYGLVGVSGAGKSTLLRCINGLETFDSGELLVNGVDIASLNEQGLNAFRKNVGMIFQHFSLLERKTVFENVAFPMKCHGVPKDQQQVRVLELLALVGLADKAQSRPRELSGGQKQRVAIARALTMNPSVLLCDEATSALDPNSSRSILELLSKINRKLGVTIVVVTHAMSVVKEVCDAAAILDHGKLTYKGSVEDLFLRHPEALKNVIGLDGKQEIDPQERVFDIVQQKGSESVLSQVALETGVPFRVVWGGLDSYRGKTAGSFRISASLENACVLEKFLRASNIEWFEISNEKDASEEMGA